MHTFSVVNMLLLAIEMDLHIAIYVIRNNATEDSNPSVDISVILGEAS